MDELVIEALLEGSHRRPTDDEITARWSDCAEAKIATCQRAVDEGIDEGIRECDTVRFIEPPPGRQVAELEGLENCLSRVRDQEDALARCVKDTEPKHAAGRTECPPDADEVSAVLHGCVADRTSELKRAQCLKELALPPDRCSPVDVSKTWATFRDQLDYDRLYEQARVVACDVTLRQAGRLGHLRGVNEAEASLKEAASYCPLGDNDPKIIKVREDLARAQAEQEAEDASREAATKEAKRCGGGTTTAFVMFRTAGQPMPKDMHGCRYAVFGKVIGGTDTLLLLAMPGQSGDGYLHVLRTREPFMDGTFFMSNRMAVFEGVETVPFSNGSSHRLPVFRLLPESAQR